MLKWCVCLLSVVGDWECDTKWENDTVDDGETWSGATPPPPGSPQWPVSSWEGLHLRQWHAVFCPDRFCRALRPAPFWWRPALFKKPKWRPALLTKKNQSHIGFSSVLPSLLPTHSVDCAVHLLLSHSRALLINSVLFLPFTALIMPFFFSSQR